MQRPLRLAQKLPQGVVNLSLVLFGAMVAVVGAEIVLSFLPVVSGLRAQPVNEKSQIYRFAPNRSFVHSTGWSLAEANTGHVNNYGFVNDADYDAADTSPLIAVIGDSYVEALMVPFSSSLGGRLALDLGDRGRVYTFAASGAPLSQYLAYADYARRQFHPDAMVFVVVGNDFDESLIEYKSAPAFHYFRRDAGGILRLTRVDYQPSRLRSIARRSALARYLLLNLKFLELMTPGAEEPAAKAEERPVRAADPDTRGEDPTATTGVRSAAAQEDATLPAVRTEPADETPRDVGSTLSGVDAKRLWARSGCGRGSRN